MNKELLNENLNQILEGLKTVIHTANAELPAILEEIVRWGIIKYSVFSLILFLFLLFFVVLAILCIKHDYESEAFVFAVLTSFMTLIFFIFTFVDLIFVYTSPKLYIINYVKDLI